MRIKKTSQTTPVQAEVVNTYSESTANAYSADYVNERFNWTLLSKVTGNNTVNLPSNFNELLLIVTVAGVDSRKISIPVPKVAISSGIGFRGGYYSESGYHGSAYVNFETTSTVNLAEARHTGSVVTSSSTLEVYYR